jgi:hypothetical protein
MLIDDAHHDGEFRSWRSEMDLFTVPGCASCFVGARNYGRFDDSCAPSELKSISMDPWSRTP